MQIGPWLVIRGFFLGAVLVVILTSVATAGATLSAQPADLRVQSDLAQSDLANAQVPASGASSCRISSHFPEQVLRWCELITHFAEQEGLAPDLIAALVWQESGGKPGAYSSSGAVGLMQVMPSDGIAASFQCANGPCFSERPTIQQLEDPEFNLQFGTRMLARLLKSSGDLREALKAYGPHDVGYYYADKVLAIFNRYGE